MSWSDLYERARRQHQAVSPACARACGIPASSYHDRIRRDGWPRPFRGSAVLPGVPIGPETMVAAAQLAIGGAPPAALWTAAYLHGLLRAAPTTVQLWLPPGTEPRRAPRLLARPSSTLTAEDRTTAGGLAVTTFARTLFDLAAVVDLDQLRAFAIDGLYQRAFALSELAAIHARTRTAPGRGLVGQILADLEGDGSDSGFEYVACERLTAAGLPPDGRQVPVVTRRTVRRLDMAYLAAKVGIECLGFSAHGSREAFEADARRSNEIAELGDWLLLRLTWRMLFDGWDEFVAQLERALRRRGAR